jgi:hypothetical protein
MKINLKDQVVFWMDPGAGGKWYSEKVRIPGRPEFSLFHPFYNVSEHFFDVGADVFEFHPNA